MTLQILWRVALFMLAFGLIGALLIVPLASALTDWQETFPILAQLFFDIAGAIAMLAATWLLTRFVDHRTFQSIGLAPKNAPRSLAAGLALGAIWLALSVGGVWAAGWTSLQTPVAVSGSLLLLLAASVFLNTLTQQLLLCGYILQTIRSRANSHVSMLASAALFSAYHAGAYHGAWLPIINVFGAALLFCLAYEVAGNLWFPVGIHFAWNLLLGPVLGLTVSGTEKMGLGWQVFSVHGPPLFTGGGFGLEGGLVVTVTSLLLIVAIAPFRFGRSIGKRKKNSLPPPVSGTRETR